LHPTKIIIAITKDLNNDSYREFSNK